MSTLFILGNGFDLDLGFDTRFSDYIKSVHFQGNNNDILGLKHHRNRNELIEIANHLESISKTDLWFDLESEIVDYYKNLINPLRSGIYSKSENEKINEKLKIHKQHVIPVIKKSINNFLIAEVHLKYNNYKIPKNENSKSAILLKKMLVEIIGRNLSKIITFNYTGVEVLTNELKNLLPVDYNKNIDYNKIIQIHGSINQLNKNDNLVFGSSSSEINDKNLAPLFDKTRQPSIKTGNWSNQFFNNFKRFVIFGHSFGETDLYFFKNLIDHFIENETAERKEMFIYTTEDGRDSIIDKIDDKYISYEILAGKTIIEYNNNEYLDEKLINSSYIKAFEPKSPIIQKYEIPESTS